MEARPRNPLSVVVEAPAKVNLTLELLGTRPDGYHAMRSLVLPVSLCERVEASPRAVVTDDLPAK